MQSNHREGRDYSDYPSFQRCKCCGKVSPSFFLSEICSFDCASKAGVDWRKHFETIQKDLDETLRSLRAK